MKRTAPPRRRKTRKAPAQPRGLRIRLNGTRTPNELQAMLLDAVARLEELGIRHARGVNVYLTPVSEDGTPLTPVANGQPVRSVTIEAPYRSAADEHGV